MSRFRNPRRPIEPLVCFLFDAQDAQGLSCRELARRSGVHENTMANWRVSRVSPSVTLWKAVVEALGYKIVLERRDP